MDHAWSWLIRILFQISILIGVSYFRKGMYLLLDSVIFCAAILWFGGCTVRLESDGFVFGNNYRSFKRCVIFCGIFIVIISSFLSLIDFRLKNDRYSKLISLNRKLLAASHSSQVRDGQSRRRFFNVSGVIAFHILSGASFLLWEHISFDIISTVYDRLCAATITWPPAILCFQYSCWVQIFTFNFERISKEIRSKIAIGKGTNAQRSTKLDHCTLSELSHKLKLVMQLKQAITDSYGSSIVFNQLHAFICLLLNCNFWSYIEFGGSGVVDWFSYPYYLLARIMYYMVLSYIPYWISQLACLEVSRLIIYACNDA